jgi:ferrous iron transport protein B
MLDTIITIHNSRDNSLVGLKPISRSCKISQSPTERYSHIEDLLNKASFVCNNSKKYILTDIIDNYLLGKYSWIVFFTIAIYLMFTMTFTFGGILSNNIENIINIIKNYLYSLLPVSTFRDIILNGIIPGLSNVIIFIPQVFILYCFIFFFENSGYITRIVFLINKMMHRIGLTGESFIPFIIGFGCNAQSILATKNIKNIKNKIITCLLIPMLSCPAKLPIYIFCTSLFFEPFIQTPIIIAIYFC